MEGGITLNMVLVDCPGYTRAAKHVSPKTAMVVLSDDPGVKTRDEERHSWLSD
jgi:hypothetical protein